MASGVNTSGANAHEPESSSRKTSISLSQIIDEENYDESADPDFTLNKDTILEEDEYEGDDDLLSDISETHITDDDTSTFSEGDGKKATLEVPVSSTEMSTSRSSLEMIEETHKKFKRFIHEQEIPRKLLHVSIGFFTLYLFTLGHQTEEILLPLGAAGLAIFSLDLLRFRWRAFNKAYCAVVGFMMREGEVNSINGVIWYILGCYFSLKFAHKDVAVMSILLLSWCDTAASTIGRRFGYLTPKIARGKSLAGSFGAFVMGVFACYFFYGYLAPKYPEYSQDFLWTAATSCLSLHALAILCGFIAALSEGIDIMELDDNLTIPVLSSLFLDVAIKIARKPLGNSL